MTGFSRSGAIPEEPAAGIPPYSSQKRGHAAFLL
jgi:hypothetical protein